MLQESKYHWKAFHSDLWPLTSDPDCSQGLQCVPHCWENAPAASGHGAGEGPVPVCLPGRGWVGTEDPHEPATAATQARQRKFWWYYKLTVGRGDTRSCLQPQMGIQLYRTSNTLDLWPYLEQLLVRCFEFDWTCFAYSRELGSAIGNSYTPGDDLIGNMHRHFVWHNVKAFYCFSPWDKASLRFQCILKSILPEKITIMKLPVSSRNTQTGLLHTPPAKHAVD